MDDTGLKVSGEMRSRLETIFGSLRACDVYAGLQITFRPQRQKTRLDIDKVKVVTGRGAGEATLAVARGSAKSVYVLAEAGKLGPMVATTHLALRSKP